MRNRVWAMCAAAVLGLASGARAQPQPAAPVKELSSLPGDPFTDPIFNPPAAPGRMTPPAPPVTLYDAATAADPLPVPPVAAAPPLSTRCVCASDYTTWLTAEWLIGTTRGASLVPVVTTGPVSAGVLAGTVGQPTTLPLFGGRPVLNDWRSGLRVEGGVWFDRDHNNGLSARFYSLFSANERFSAPPTGAIVVNLPQFTPAGAAMVQTPLFVSFPGTTAGSVSAYARTTFSGVDVDLRHLIDSDEKYRLELLAGYRQLYLGDALGTSYSITPATAIPFVSPRLFGNEDIRTRNDFYGPQLGLFASTRWNRFTLEAHAASALGVTVSHLDSLHTQSLTTTPIGTPLSTTAALVGLGLPLATAAVLTPTARALANNQLQLARSGTSNALTYFGVVGEGGLRLNWRATDHVRLTAGYSFLYWNNVRRAEEMYLSGTALRPRAVDFTTHLFSVGLDVRY